MRRAAFYFYDLVARPCLITVLILSASACAPPLSMGYIPIKPRHAGAVNVSAQGGAGYPPLFYGGAFHIELFFTPRWSLPVTVGGARIEQDARGTYDYFVSSRMGVRHRPSRYVTAGGGVTAGGIVRNNNCAASPDHCDFTRRDSTMLQFDFELAMGHRWKHIGFSFGIRVVTLAVGGLDLQFPLEASLVWFPTGRTFGIAVHGLLGFTLLANEVYGAGGLGIVIEI